MNTSRALLLAIVLVNAAPGWAQSDSRLTAAVTLAQEGYGDSARATVAKVLASAAPTDPLYAEALLTSARVASDADETRRALQRVAVEHALTAWADDAVLALAELDYASGNLPAARRNLERFRTDFSGSPLFARAAFWAARAAFDARDERRGCEWVGMGLARMQDDDPDTRGQLDFFARRCSAAQLSAASAAAPPAAPVPIAIPARDSVVAAAPVTVVPPAADTAPAQPTPQANPGVLRARVESVTPPPTGQRFYRVQVVAAGDQAAADAAVARLGTIGFTSRIFREGGFLKVRAGEYASRGEAQAAASRLKEAYPGAFPVRDP